jgi:hypothetical protein
LAGSLLLVPGCGDSAGVLPAADAGRVDTSDDLASARDTGGTGDNDAGSNTNHDAENDATSAAPADAEFDATEFDADDGPAPADADTGAEDTPVSTLADAETSAEDAPTDAEPNAEDAPSAAPTDAESDAGLDTESAVFDVASDTSTDAEADAMASAPVVPALNGSVYSFAFGDTTFAVDTAKGGRIVTFSLSNRNILTTPATGDPANYGSTFWSSPQSDWNWPPPTQIDPGPYVGSLAGAALSLTSATAPTLGLAVTKEFSVDSGTGIVTIKYGLVNHGTQARSCAPWEITRVAAGGLTFFPMGDGAPSKGAQDLLALKIVDGVAWFAYDTKLITADQKVFADGHEGWIAHVNGDLLLVKSFADTPAGQAAPGEAEIEIYTNAGHTYIEVENQGATTRLAPAARSQWTVRWFLRKLDPSVSVTVGSADLLGIVRALVNG